VANCGFDCSARGVWVEMVAPNVDCKKDEKPDRKMAGGGKNSGKSWRGWRGAAEWGSWYLLVALRGRSLGVGRSQAGAWEREALPVRNED